MIWRSLALSLASVTVLALPTKAEINPNGQSILCKQKNWLTEIAISSPEFVVAICIDQNASGNINSFELTPTHYVGQNKKTGEKIILPLTESNNIPAEPAFYKAVNKQYTYQVYVSMAQKYSPQCQCQGININTVTFSVFKNGQRVYKYQTNKYLTGWR